MATRRCSCSVTILPNTVTITVTARTDIRDGTSILRCTPLTCSYLPSEGWGPISDGRGRHDCTLCGRWQGRRSRSNGHSRGRDDLQDACDGARYCCISADRSTCRYREIENKFECDVTLWCDGRLGSPG